MTLIVDAGVLVAQADPRHPAHGSSAELLRSEPGALITSEAAAAEADYLIEKYLGRAAEGAFLRDLATRTFEVECMTPTDLEAASRVVDRYGDLGLGLADASIVVLAHRHKTTIIATLDHRHFRAVEPLQGGQFTILPADT